MHIDLMKKVFQVSCSEEKSSPPPKNSKFVMNQKLYADGLNAFRAENELNFNE